LWNAIVTAFDEENGVLDMMKHGRNKELIGLRHRDFSFHWDKALAHAHFIKKFDMEIEIACGYHYEDRILKISVDMFPDPRKTILRLHMYEYGDKLCINANDVTFPGEIDRDIFLHIAKTNRRVVVN
jgi:hypothetical protein